MDREIERKEKLENSMETKMLLIENKSKTRVFSVDNVVSIGPTGSSVMPGA